MLGMSRAQVHELIDQGLLNHRVVGTEHRVLRASIQAFAEAQRTRSSAAMHDLAALQNDLGLAE